MKALKVQRGVERVFCIVLVLVLEDLGWSHGWDPPSPSLRRDRPDGTHETYG